MLDTRLTIYWVLAMNGSPPAPPCPNSLNNRLDFLALSLPYKSPSTDLCFYLFSWPAFYDSKYSSWPCWFKYSSSCFQNNSDHSPLSLTTFSNRLNRQTQINRSDEKLQIKYMLTQPFNSHINKNDKIHLIGTSNSVYFLPWYKDTLNSGVYTLKKYFEALL